MSIARVRPGRLVGRMRAPPSKSYTHRALVVAHLAHRRFRVVSPLDSDDTRATARALVALGSRVVRSREAWTVAPGSERDSLEPCTIDCGESGTTLRFALALSALSGREVRLVGLGRLPDRPIGPLVGALRALGGSTSRPVGSRHHLPLTIRGPLRGGAVEVDASESSQYASALLLIAPVLPEPTRLRLSGRIVSEPYLDATIAVLQDRGIRLTRRGRSFGVPGGQQYRGGSYRVPGDASSAAYVWAAAALSQGRVLVDGISPTWPQADLAILDILKSGGARVRRVKNGAAVAAGERRPFSVDLTGAPDLYPLAGALGALTQGTSRLRGAPQIALKESDRREGTERLVAALGGRSRRTAHGLEIDGSVRPRGFSMTGETDHRLVMSAAVAALAAEGPSRVGHAEAVRKSWPGFWTALESLRSPGGPR